MRNITIIVAVCLCAKIIHIHGKYRYVHSSFFTKNVGLCAAITYRVCSLFFLLQFRVALQFINEAPNVLNTTPSSADGTAPIENIKGRLLTPSEGCGLSKVPVNRITTGAPAKKGVF